VAATPTRRTKQAPLKVDWDDGVLHLYETWHRRVAAAETGHRLMADRLRRRHLGLGIPVVVFTTIVGTSVFASMEGANAGTAVLALVGGISLTAAVLSSLQTFLRYATRAEGHRIAAIRYETLRRDMAKMLAVPPEARGDSERALDSVRQRMDRYAKESPTFGERLWKRLADEFQLSRVPPDPHRAQRAVVIPEPAQAAEPVEPNS
jgi:hypothetical protein